MGFTPQAGEAFTIRRKVLKLFGAAFHVYDAHGTVVGYCKQKAFKLREDIRIYTDESMSKELIRIAARTILDFSTTYDVVLSDGTVVGSFRRKGLKSTFLRDEWMVFDQKNVQVGLLQEDSAWMGFLRRTVELAAVLFPQKYQLLRSDGSVAARLRQHFNIFVYRLGVAPSPDLKTDEPLDEMMILAAGCLIAAIEGRQSS
jgi:uncharacterized protein YxjI